MSTLLITNQILYNVRVLHELGYLHNDLKLENIVVGGQDPTKIILIDFGLSIKYKDKKGRHRKFKQFDSFSGNFMFASNHVC